MIYTCFSNDYYLILEYLKNDNDKPKKTNLDFLESIIALHSVSNDFFGFDFNTQIGALEQINNFEKSWSNFYSEKRLHLPHCGIK